jgi:polyribonucleotide nucleotidyltransferase
MSESQMDLCVAGTKEAIMMVECGSNEVSEEKVAEALQYGHSVLADAVEIQNKLIEACGGRKIEEYEPAGHHEHVTDTIYEFVKDKLGENVRGINNKVREEKTDALWHQLRENFKDHEGFEEHYGIWRESFENILKKEVRRAILEEGIRPDGRGTEEIRTISCETGLLPRTHGSAIFTRGTTQALNVVTLASLKYAQTVETMEEDTEKTYIHHYNMPGYSTGECRRLGNPGRREIGHGALAERALIAVLPSTAQFPYTIRTVSEIMSSNGSTSMASVCSSCLALMDAGVPIKAPVSGIAMGLIGDGNGKFVILSDIQGVEDFAGDMDFKVAGTKNGITALQMDIKIHGISPKLMAEALSQAKRGRDHILDEMLKVLPEPKKEMSPYAPRVESLQINPELIGKVIGKGGETIQDITADSGAEIDINDDGIVMISSPNAESIQKAKEMILALTAVPEVGKIYSGKVVKIMDFGAFVNIMPGIDGMVHISALKNERVEKVTDVLKEGDVVNVKLVAIDDRGKLSLSMKDAI